MFDFKGVFGWIGSGITIIFGMVTLNDVTITTGMIAGVTTIIWNVRNFYLSFKNKKNK